MVDKHLCALQAPVFGQEGLVCQGVTKLVVSKPPGKGAPPLLNPAFLELSLLPPWTAAVQSISLLVHSNGFVASLNFTSMGLLDTPGPETT